jgi:hypothetical protein
VSRCACRTLLLPRRPPPGSRPRPPGPAHVRRVPRTTWLLAWRTGGSQVKRPRARRPSRTRRPSRILHASCFTPGRRRDRGDHPRGPARGVGGARICRPTSTAMLLDRASSPAACDAGGHARQRRGGSRPRSRAGPAPASPRRCSRRHGDGRRQAAAARVFSARFRRGARSRCRSSCWRCRSRLATTRRASGSAARPWASRSWGRPRWSSACAQTSPRWPTGSSASSRASRIAPRSPSTTNRPTRRCTRPRSTCPTWCRSRCRSASCRRARARAWSGSGSRWPARCRCTTRRAGW